VLGEGNGESLPVHV